MERKEYVRDVGTQAETRSEVEKILNRLILGRRDLDCVRPVLAKHTPDEILGMFERPPEDDCLHCKGGKIPSPRSDYAIRVHTFADGHRNVKCTICGKEWSISDPEARYMMNRTTNTPSSSEVSIEVVERARQESKLEIHNRLLRQADAFYRLQEAEEILYLLDHGSRLSVSEKLYLRIRHYKEQLTKLGEENASSNR
jgi:hypothetical protein